MNSEFTHYVGAMHAYRVATEIELGCNFFVGLAVYDQL
jgi:hypothetical protein